MSRILDRLYSETVRVAPGASEVSVRNDLAKWANRALREAGSAPLRSLKDAVAVRRAVAALEATP